MRSRLLLAFVGLALGAGLVACGDDDDSGGKSAETSEQAAAVTPQQAISEIAVVREGLDDALASYGQGESSRAEQLVGDAYLEHFELVEVPLEGRDEELNEELEELIRERLRGAISDGAPERQVASLVADAQRGLDQAEEALSR